jgi:hypothetical protein
MSVIRPRTKTPSPHRGEGGGEGLEPTFVIPRASRGIPLDAATMRSMTMKIAGARTNEWLNCGDTPTLTLPRTREREFTEL